MSRIRVEDATVRYGTVAALDHCSIMIEPGELLAVLGPSGCGKSTLLRAIAGLASLDEGRIVVGERDVTALPPAQRDVAMVFQGYALFPHLDVAANIGFGLRARKRPTAEIHDAVTAIAATLGIDRLLGRRPHELSGGERQRVALARALVRAPAVALLDEPLASLDAPLRISARAEIARLQRERGTTILHVTHDQAEAMALGHRIAVLRAGSVVQIGTPDQIYAEPADIFVARFVGSPPMNIVAADAWDSGGPAAAWRGIRPEDLVLEPLVEPATREGIAARITRIERLGDHVLVALEPEPPIDVIEELYARTSTDVAFDVGARVLACARRSVSFDGNGRRIP